MGPYGVRINKKGIQKCMSKVHSGSFGVGYDNYSLFYRIAKVLRGSYGVRKKYDGMNACVIKVQSGSFGVGYDNYSLFYRIARS